MPSATDLLSRDRDELVAVVRALQQRCWDRGDRVLVEAFLGEFSFAENPEAPLELVLGEVNMRQNRGETPALKEYQERFPSLSSRLAQAFGGLQTVDGQVETPRLRHSEFPHVPGFEVLEHLGEGGMGIVYKARQLGLNRLVALKMILAGVHATTEQRQRFLGEAKSVARLQHPNVVQIYEVGSYQGNVFLALEYIDGPTLSTHCNNKPQAPKWSAEMVEVLARAVHHAHEKGVVHRDLKPGNVMLAGEPAAVAAGSATPKVMDFGLARQVEVGQGQTQTGAVMGTPSFMAPEQALGEGKRVGPAADVWALGAILYHLLTGRPPFLGATTFETLQQVVNAEPVAVRQLQPSCPRDLETICHKCLQKDASKRYSSALTAADDLRRFLNGEPITARPVGVLERGWSWCRRNPVVAALTATVAVVVLIAVTVGTGLLVHANSQSQRADERDAAAVEQAALRDQADRDRVAAEQAKASAESEKGKADAAAAEANTLREKAVAAEAKSARLAMVAQLGRVDVVYQQDPGQAKSLLYDVNAIPIPLRDSAWRFFERTCSRWELGTLQGHTDAAYSVVFSPDGLTLASASHDRTVRLWNVRTGQLKSSLQLQGVVGPMAFSPDGLTLATTYADCTLQFWDVKTGKHKATVQGNAEMGRPLAFSPDGLSLASASQDNTVRLWNVKTGQHKANLAGHTKWILTVTFSPDGLTLASSSQDDTVRLWDVKTGQQKTTLLGHKGSVRSVAFHPDGLTLASVSGLDERMKPIQAEVRLWDVKTGRHNTILQDTSNVHLVTFSPDGLTLAGASTNGALGDVDLWDVKKGKHKATLNGHTSGISSLAFSPNGLILASASHDSTVRLWDMKAGPQMSTLMGHTSLVKSVAYSPDGRTLASGSEDRTIRLWDAKTGQYRATLQGHNDKVWSVAFSPDGLTLASGSGDKTARLWDVKTGQLRATIEGHEGYVETVAFSPDGLTLATGAGQTIQLWDVKTAQNKGIHQRYSDHVTCVAYSPDGLTVASVSADDPPKLCDAKTGELKIRIEGLDSEFYALAFSPDSLTLAGTTIGNTVRIWDVKTGRVKAILQGHKDAVRSVAFSPDGLTLATGSTDRTVRLWDLQTGQPTATLPGHTNLVGSVAFSPDGLSLASASDDGTVRIWDMKIGQHRATLQGHLFEVAGVAFTSDGQRVFGWDSSNKAFAWTARDGQLTSTDNPPPNFSKKQATSPDGSLRAEVHNKDIVLLDLANHDPQREYAERMALESITRIPWHHQQAEQAEKDSDWFAAAFHLGQLLKDKPEDPDLLRRSKDARDKLAPR